MKKRNEGSKAKLVLNNRLLYSLILLGALLIFTVGVYAVNTPTSGIMPGVSPNPGHNISQVGAPSGCADGQVLAYTVDSGGAGKWSCVASTYYDPTSGYFAIGSGNIGPHAPLDVLGSSSAGAAILAGTDSGAGTLRFVPGSSNNDFWIELYNHGFTGTGGILHFGGMGGSPNLMNIDFQSSKVSVNGAFQAGTTTLGSTTVGTLSVSQGTSLNALNAGATTVTSLTASSLSIGSYGIVGTGAITGSSLSITGTGDANVGGNVNAAGFYYTSDKNLKTNIENLNSLQALQNIERLQGVSFNWKSNGEPSLGFVAQDVQKVYPELVRKNADGSLVLNYAGLIAPLVETVKLQQQEIEDLQKQVNELKSGK